MRTGGGVADLGKKKFLRIVIDRIPIHGQCSCRRFRQRRDTDSLHIVISDQMVLSIRFKPDIVECMNQIKCRKIRTRHNQSVETTPGKLQSQLVEIGREFRLDLLDIRKPVFLRRHTASIPARISRLHDPDR